MSWQPTPPTAFKHNILAACKLITTGSLEYTWLCPCSLPQLDNSGLFPILIVPTASIPNTNCRFQHGPTENWTFYRQNRQPIPPLQSLTISPGNALHPLVGAPARSCGGQGRLSAPVPEPHPIHPAHVPTHPNNTTHSTCTIILYTHRFLIYSWRNTTGLTHRLGWPILERWHHPVCILLFCA